ncbi:MAG: Ku protein, partial [Clostridia bacterium]|nr:Ku protein [Clostridia bacterium]
MAYSYKGAISFGLIYIPINLQASVKNNDVSFNLLDKNTMSRIKYKKTCVDCDDKEVKQQDIVKGYEYEKDRYVVFDDKDFEKIKSEKDKNITIEKFVDIAEIDPIFYDKAYYVLPTGAEKAYALLAKSMEEAGKVGIAKTVLGTKETLVAVRVKDGQMLLSTMFFNDEVQK